MAFNDLNQIGTYGNPIIVEDFINSKSALPSLSITAMEKTELSELNLLGFDVTEGRFDGKGKFTINEYGPQYNLKKKSLTQKNIFKIFGGEQVNVNKNGSVTVTEFANDGSEYAAVANIVASNQGIFTTVTGLKETDEVLVVKKDAANNTVEAKVKITAVDSITNELTFDSNVTIDAGDYIKYLTTDTFGCQFNNKKVGDFQENGKDFTYHLQRFSRCIEIKNEDFEETFTNVQQKLAFDWKYWEQPLQEMLLEVADSLRHGSGMGWAAPKIRGYDTIIEERHAAGIPSIIDLSALTTAQDHINEMKTILFDVAQAPVDSKMIGIGNYSFHRAYKNALQELRVSADAMACCKLQDTIHDGIMKWSVEEAPMIDLYVSQELSKEKRYTGTLYILPVDLIAGFTARFSDLEFRNGNVQKKNALFGSASTMEDVSKRSHECRTYEHFMKLGFLFGAVSFRDTYKRIDNFNFGL